MPKNTTEFQSAISKMTEEEIDRDMASFFKTRLADTEVDAGEKASTQRYADVWPNLPLKSKRELYATLLATLKEEAVKASRRPCCSIS